MSLRFGILGFLSKWEASGYDLKKEFDDIMSVFWHSHLSQIYPELNKLEKDEFIKSRLVEQEGKPDKKMYSITEKGKGELINWLLTPPEIPKMKDAFLMQTLFMDNIPADEVLLKLHMYKKERQQRLNKMQSIVSERINSLKERNVIKPRILMSSAVLKRGLDQEIQYIKWCEDTIGLVEACKYLWDKEEYILNNSTSVVPFTEVEEIIMNYFGDFYIDNKA